MFQTRSGAVQFKALLVDFDGVVRHWPAQDPDFEQRFGLEQGAIRRVAFKPELLEMAVTGRMTDEAWRRSIVEALTTQYAHADVGAAIQCWSRPVGVVDADVLALLSLARDHVRLVLVTNATSRLDADLSALGLRGYFDEVVNSSVIGVAKPDPRYFEEALARAGALAGQVLYVDDSAGNVEAARLLGVAACLYEGVESLHAFLQAHGVLHSSQTRE